jgi:hypothetical protein
MKAYEVKVFQGTCVSIFTGAYESTSAAIAAALAIFGFTQAIRIVAYERTAI